MSLLKAAIACLGFGILLKFLAANAGDYGISGSNELSDGGNWAIGFSLVFFALKAVKGFFSSSSS